MSAFPEQPAPPPQPPKRRWRRRALWTVVLFPVLLLLLVGALLLSLATRPVRRELLQYATERLRRDLGVELAVRDFSTLGWRGLQLHEVRAGAPGARPLVTAERVDAVFDWDTLLHRRSLRLRSLEVIAPRIDLAAPFPEVPESPTGESSTPFEIDRLTVVRGTVRGAPLEPPASRWVSAWQIDGLKLSGRYRKERLTLQVEEGQATLQRPGLPEYSARLAAQEIAYQDGRPLQVSGLTAEGAGLLLKASAGFDLAAMQPLQGDFSLRMQPGQLAPQVVPGGELSAEGRFDVPATRVEVRLSGKDLPAEAAKPYLDPALFADLSLAGTVVDVAPTLVQLGPGSWERVSGGPVALTWRQGRKVRAQVQARLESSAPVRLSVAGELLPGSPGQRTWDGTIVARSWAELAAGRLEKTTAKIAIPNLASALAELGKIWPRLIPALSPELPIRGSLAATGRFSGPLTAPTAELQARWQPDPGAQVDLRGRAQLPDGRGEATVRATGFPLETLGLGIHGTATATARLDGSLKSMATRLEGEIAGLSYPPQLESIDRLSFSTSGNLRPETLRYDGSVEVSGLGLTARPNASDTVQIADFHLTAEGRLDGQKLSASSGRGSLQVSRATWADLTLTDLRLEAEGDGREVRVSSISGALPEGDLPRRFSGSGRATLAPLLAEADLDLEVEKPLQPVDRVELSARLREGVLALDIPRIESAAGPARAAARVPLGALLGVPALREALAGLPLQFTPGLVSVRASAPSLDSESLLAALGQPARPERVRAGLEAELTFDPAKPLAGQGEVQLSGLSIVSPEGSARTDDVVRLQLAGGTLTLPPVRWKVTAPDLPEAGVDLRGSAALDPAWEPAQPVSEMVRKVQLSGGGTLEAALLNPFLQGGVGSGPLTFSAEVAGPVSSLRELRAEVQLHGPEASFLWAQPYLTRLQAPELALQMKDGRLQIRRGTVKLNGGTVELSGGGDPGGTIGIEAAIAGVRYRFLDLYGFAATFDGRLRLEVPAEGRWQLSGRIDLDRGVIDRDVDPDREIAEVLRSFLAPVEVPGSEPGLLEQIDLDLRVTSADGVRVKNNVADLRAYWSALEVGGTAAVPVIRGRIDLDPGGLVHLYGQTLRIDRGSVTLTGDPFDPFRPDFATSSSLTDPSVRQAFAESGDPLAALDAADPRSAEEGQQGQEADMRKLAEQLGYGVGYGVAGYYGERLFGRLVGRSVGIGLEIAGEADPTARLTVKRELSRNLGFLASLDLTNAERQTYLLDLHGLRELPSLSLQGFTSDAGTYGGNLRQVLDLGGSPQPASAAPRLRRLTLQAPPGMSKWAVRQARRAVQLQKGEPVPAGSALDVEVVVADRLLKSGYPDARVAAEIVPVEGNSERVDVKVQIEPAPKVTVAFEGDVPPRASRQAIAGLYRSDFYEATAIEEMKERTVRTFRALGHLEPAVEIAVTSGENERRVVVRSAAGRTVGLGQLLFPGTDPDIARELAARFASRLARVELAVGKPESDRRLVEALRTLGFPEASIGGREISADGSRLAVSLALAAPGDRRVLTEVAVTGVDGEEEQRLLALLRETVDLRPGIPARADQVTAAARELEQDLHRRGFADARVRTVFAPASPEVDPPWRAAFEVNPGLRYRLAEVRFQGQRWTPEGQLRRVAQLEVGGELNETELAEARTRLLATGLFRRVDSDLAKREDGTAAVTFTVNESPRFHLGYGARWESEVGTEAVLDFADQNLLGRGITWGVRGLYKSDEQSGRLYLRKERVFGAISFDAFAQYSREPVAGGLLEDVLESSVQLDRPFGRYFEGRLYGRYVTTHQREEEPDPFFPLDFRFTNPYLGVQVVYDSRDDLIAPSRGLFGSFDVAGSGPWLGEELDYARIYTQLNSYRRIAEVASRPLLWAQSVRVGWGFPQTGRRLPSRIRFKAGGEFSVRGYPTETLGPAEVLGEGVTVRLGGDALFVLNEELRWPVWNGLTALAFADLGQVWEETDDIDTDFAKALGLGFRFATPIGLLRFDAGFPLDRREGDEAYQLYFGFGNAF